MMPRKPLLLLLLTLTVFSASAQKRVMLWFDAHANYKRLSSTDSIRFYLQRSKDVGVTDIVVDVKPITGFVLWKSKYAPYLGEWQGNKMPAALNYLQTFIDEGHKLGLTIHASINVFSGGHNHFNKGIIYQDHAEWQSINYLDTGLTKISAIKSKYSGMLNPADPEVQQYQLNLLKELIKKHPGLDGVILDRVRYDGFEADFSEVSRKQFEKYTGQKVVNFPADVYSYTKKDGKSVKTPGPLYKQWIEWRASVIYNFFVKARATAKKANAKIIFGDYTGAWYPTYYEVGVNWASNKFDVAKEYNWATPKYQQYGYAELLDLYTTGCYYYEVTKEEVHQSNSYKAARTEAGMSTQRSPVYSVEGSAERAMELTKGAAPLLGGLYVEQYEKNKDQFIRAMQMCMDRTNGLMIFDLVHIVQRNWWDAIQQVTGK